MAKRLIDVEERLLAEARQVLGTQTIKETVNTALRRTVENAGRTTVDLASLRRFAQASQDLQDPSVMARAWE